MIHLFGAGCNSRKEEEEGLKARGRCKEEWGTRREERKERENLRRMCGDGTTCEELVITYAPPHAWVMIG